MCKVVSAVFFFLGAFFYKPPPPNFQGSESELKQQTETVNEAFQPDESNKPVEANGESFHVKGAEDDDEEPVTSL